MAHAGPTKEEVIDREKSYWDAMKQKDGDRTSKLSAKTSPVTGAKGVMSVPKSKMAAMTEEGKWTLEAYAFSDVEISTPTPDVAIIVYKVKQKVTMDGKTQDLGAADSTIWVRGPDGWECHAHSEAFLNEAV